MSVASEVERQMLDLINAERTSRGLDALTLERRLNDATEDHSVWMDDTRVFSHTGVGGSDPGDRMRDAGFQFSGNWTWGENIAYQSERGAPGISDDVVDLHTALMNSPGHRANILNPNFELIGIGIEEGDGRGFDAVYVTQNFARTSAPVQLDLPTGPTPPDDGRILGTGGSDALVGTSGSDDLRGRGGNDTLSGDNGADLIFAGSGNDRAYGQGGNDRMWGGTGNDTLFGDAGADRIKGEAGDDRLWGGNGDDGILGGAGNDAISGGAGRDRLVGGTGNDRLDGDAGNDRLTGEAGGDTFVFATGWDVVTDFDPNQSGERIDLRGAGPITDFGDLMSGGHIRQSGTNTVIEDGIGNTMVLVGVDLDALQANDFLF